MRPSALALSDAATVFGVSQEFLAKVVEGSGRITQELADGLERSGFSTARFWLTLQAEYDLNHSPK